MTDRPKTQTDTATVAAPASTQPATRNEGPVFSSEPPHGTGKGVAALPDGLEEQGRSVCLSLEGPGGEVLARVELVLLGRAEPVSLPITTTPPPDPPSDDGQTLGQTTLNRYAPPGKRQP